MKKLLILSAVLLLPTAVVAQQATGGSRAGARTRTPLAQAHDNLYRFVFAGHQALGEAGDRRVNLEVKDASVEQAAREVLKAGKVEMDLQLDADVPKDARLSIAGTNLRVATALDLVAQAGGASWAVEKKDGKSVVRIGKKVSPQSVLSAVQSLAPGTFALTPNIPPVPTIGGFGGDFLFAQGNLLERRSTFQCPHCKGTSTFIRRTEQPKCPKCERLFQPQWNFCPNDGARRPVSPSELKFCPLCGKGVEPEKPSR